MKVFSVCLLAACVAMMAGCHGGRIDFAGSGRSHAGAGRPERAATGSCEHPFDGNRARAGDGDCVRAGCQAASSRFWCARETRCGQAKLSP